MTIIEAFLLFVLIVWFYMYTIEENREMVLERPFYSAWFCAKQTYYLIAGSMMFLIVLLQEIFLPNYFGDDTGDYY